MLARLVLSQASRYRLAVRHFGDVNTAATAAERRAARKAAREAKAAAGPGPGAVAAETAAKPLPGSPSTTRSLSTRGWVAFYGVTGSLGFASWLFSPYAKDTAIGKAAQESYAWRWIVIQLDEISKPFSEPVRDKLLPDWPYFPNIPPDTPCPPTLVLDLEGTLVKSTWDKKYGWRHAKRPGVDKFLTEMSNYYEIVLFSPNIAGNAEPIMLMLDKNQRVMHRLFRESTKFVNGVHVKDLSYMNRNMKKMVLIDDDPAAYQLQPDNAIHIEPFNNPRDKSDTSLEDLIPILAALVNEEVQDFPATLSTFSSREARDISAEYMTKLSSVKERQDRAQTRGLGGFIRQNSIRQTVPMAEEKAPGAEIVAAALAGKDPLEKTDLPPQGAMKKKGRFWDSLDAAKKEADEARQKKMQAFHEFAIKKEQERKANADA
mmetsp:Transcript_35759/g.82810  ORF Transcript_35759/g.82810 Transcript_35759/m.82810 type:complete len:432 (+) Transcript_35759:1-1296(+)